MKTVIEMTENSRLHLWSTSVRDKTTQEGRSVSSGANLTSERGAFPKSSKLSGRTKQKLRSWGTQRMWWSMLGVARESMENRADRMEGRSSELDGRNLEMFQGEEEREVPFWKEEWTLWELSDPIGKRDIRIMGIPEGWIQGQRGTESLCKGTVGENFPHLRKELDVRVQDANRMPTNLNTEGPPPRHIAWELSEVNDQERVLKGSQGEKTGT